MSSALSYLGEPLELEQEPYWQRKQHQYQSRSHSVRHINLYRATVKQPY